MLLSDSISKSLWIKDKTIGDYPEVHTLAEKVWGMLDFPQKNYKKRRKRSTSKRILCCCIDAVGSGRDRLLIPRNKKAYERGGWMHKEHYSYRNTRALVRAYRHAELFYEAEEGGERRTTQEGITEKLQALIKEVLPDHYRLRRGEAFPGYVVVRGPEDKKGKRPFLPVPDTKWTMQQSKDLQAYDEMMRQVEVQVEVPAHYFDKAERKRRQKQITAQASQRKGRSKYKKQDVRVKYKNIHIKKYAYIEDKALYRSFSGDNLLGGRHYGNRMQFLPDHIRQTALFDGSPTVYCDFSATFCHMLYHKAGGRYEGDPYLVYSNPDTRDFMKKALLCAICCDGEGKWYNGVMGALKEKCKTLAALEKKSALQQSINAIGKELAEILDDLKHYHSDIGELLFRNMSLPLMRLESDIAHDLICFFTSKGKPIIPVFDGFHVREEDGDLLRSAMAEFSEKWTRFAIPAK